MANKEEITQLPPKETFKLPKHSSVEVKHQRDSFNTIIFQPIVQNVDGDDPNEENDITNITEELSVS